jgi:hypothetical protein
MMTNIVQTVREIRLQVGVVRVLLDEVECVDPSRLSSAQLHEELARLGCRMLEAASALSKDVPPVADDVADGHMGQRAT